MNKTLVFDMDGTLNNFYGVDGWLNDLENENTRPYEVCEPLWDMKTLKNVLVELKKKGWKIAVTTWLAKNATKDYDNAVRKVKLEWLEKYEFPYDEIHMVKYGTTKATCTRKNGGYQILIDDNDKIRKGWKMGHTINPTEENLINRLNELKQSKIL